MEQETSVAPGSVQVPSGPGRLVDRRPLSSKVRMHVHNLEHARTPGYRAQKWTPTSIDLSEAQGEFQCTERDLDVAIEGDGFFCVRLPDQSAAYTRSGRFYIDGDGKIVTHRGYVLDPRITIPENVTRIMIDASGGVQGFDSSSPEVLQPIGQFQLIVFANAGKLEPLGDNLYRATPEAGVRLASRPARTRGFGLVRQGALEKSNVEVEKEATELRRTLVESGCLETCRHGCTEGVGDVGIDSCHR